MNLEFRTDRIVAALPEPNGFGGSLKPADRTEFFMRGRAVLHDPEYWDYDPTPYRSGTRIALPATVEIVGESKWSELLRLTHRIRESPGEWSVERQRAELDTLNESEPEALLLYQPWRRESGRRDTNSADELAVVLRLGDVQSETLGVWLRDVWLHNRRGPVVQLRGLGFSLNAESTATWEEFLGGGHYVPAQRARLDLTPL